MRVAGGEVISTQLERMLKIAEVAAYLGVSERTVWRRIAAGMLPEPVRSVRTTRMPESDVKAYMERLKRGRGQ